MAKGIYGYDDNGSPMRTQKEVLKDYFIKHPGKENALSHETCKEKFGFTRLSALVYRLEHDYPIAVSREKREVPTRYFGITAAPTFYWVEKEVAEGYSEFVRKMNERLTE